MCKTGMCYSLSFHISLLFVFHILLNRQVDITNGWMSVFSAMSCNSKVLSLPWDYKREICLKSTNKSFLSLLPSYFQKYYLKRIRSFFGDLTFFPIIILLPEVKKESFCTAACFQVLLKFYSVKNHMNTLAFSCVN